MKRLLIANRAEIACRIMRTARQMGIETVAVYSDPDRDAAHVALADHSVGLGGADPASSYLNIDAIIEAARSAGADAVHPGYGFLAENASFASAVEGAGLVFVGPSAECIELMGDKIRARELAAKCGMPLVPSAPLGDDEQDNQRAADALGYPVLVKAAAGGGGRGMRAVHGAQELGAAVAGARREAQAAFGDPRVYLERLVEEPRHIEVQVFGDRKGTLIDLGERECSIQRRHQKVIEEAPSPAVNATMRKQMAEAALALAGALHYTGAGTVEFIADRSGTFYFLEMNTRLQVEHPVTEMITSTDLVRWQLEVADGASLPSKRPTLRGHAVECRVYAEDPANGFLPTSGTVQRVEHPQGPGVRVDSCLYDGLVIPTEYDPMLAKVIAWAPDRAHAIHRLQTALREFAILGVVTNASFLIDVLGDEAFSSGSFSTSTLAQRFASWRHGDGSGRAAACVAAAILSRAGGHGSSHVDAQGRDRTPGPWETLGAWRLGTRGGR